VTLSDPLTAAMQVMPIQGTCLGHQLLQILASDVNFTELLVPTDSVVRRHPVGDHRSLLSRTLTCNATMPKVHWCS